jgi:hypothetical protein
VIFIVIALCRKGQGPAGAAFLDERIADRVDLATLFPDLAAGIEKRKAGWVIDAAQYQRFLGGGIIQIYIEDELTALAGCCT